MTEWKPYPKEVPGTSTRCIVVCKVDAYTCLVDAFYNRNEFVMITQSDLYGDRDVTHFKEITLPREYESSTDGI